jgi:hypothetical protein
MLACCVHVHLFVLTTQHHAKSNANACFVDCVQSVEGWDTLGVVVVCPIIVVVVIVVIE